MQNTNKFSLLFTIALIIFAAINIKIRYQIKWNNETIKEVENKLHPTLERMYTYWREHTKKQSKLFEDFEKNKNLFDINKDDRVTVNNKEEIEKCFNLKNIEPEFSKTMELLNISNQINEYLYNFGTHLNQDITDEIIVTNITDNKSQDIRIDMFPFESIILDSISVEDQNGRVITKNVPYKYKVKPIELTFTNNTF